MIVKIKAGCSCKVNGVDYVVRGTGMATHGFHGLCDSPELTLESETGERLVIKFDGFTFAISETALTPLHMLLTNG